MSHPEPYEPPRIRLDRRTAIVWMGTVAAAIGGCYLGLGDGGPSPITGPGYGRDPKLTEPGSWWSRTLDPEQLRSVELLCDFILPAEGSAPSAGALAVHEFIDEWVSAPYPDQAADRILILAGLNWIKGDAKRRANAASFPATAKDIRKALLTDLANGTSSGQMAPTGFYARFRRLVIGAYYTTEAGFKDIGFIGNVPMQSYPGPSPDVIAALERAYEKLGLTGFPGPVQG